MNEELKRLINHYRKIDEKREEYTPLGDLLDELEKLIMTEPEPETAIDDCPECDGNARDKYGTFCEACNATGIKKLRKFSEEPPGSASGQIETDCKNCHNCRYWEGICNEDIEEYPYDNCPKYSPMEG